MIKFAVCDDEPLMVRALAAHIENYMKEKQMTAYSVTCFSHGQPLLEADDGFDVIFLDICMEQPDGMETARQLRRRGDRSLLIFVTVLEECVFDAFQVEAYDFLLKPLDSTRFQQTMDRALKRLDQRAKARDNYHIILLDWKLPDMDGIAAAKEIRSRFGDETPIMLISAYDWSEIEAEAKDAGITGFISKPLFRSTLFYGLKP